MTSMKKINKEKQCGVDTAEMKINILEGRRAHVYKGPFEIKPNRAARRLATRIANRTERKGE